MTDCAVVEALRNELAIGEAEAIALALELGAEQVLVDKRRGCMVAAKLNLLYLSAFVEIAT